MIFQRIFKILLPRRSKNKINLGFWSNLRKPIFVLAPMADVTDYAFRNIINKYGKPDVFWTEFVSADGLNSPGRDKLIVDLRFDKKEHPIVAQIFGSNLKNLEATARLCRELGFDGIDINMGCPDRAIIKQGCGVGHIQNPKHARRVIRAVKKGAGDLPVSVKTRLGFNKDEVETWIPNLLKENIAVLTVHARTKKDMSKVPARWERMKRIVEIRDEMKKETLIFGNGDAIDIEDGKRKVKEFGVDGVMFGRAIFGNPWLFDENKKEVSIREKLTVMLEHTKLFVETLTGHKNFNLMKKHYKAYVNGFSGAKELRMKLMDAENYEEIERLTLDFLKNR